MILVVIPIAKETARAAERLLDLIYWQGEKEQLGQCFLAFAPDVHPEEKKRLLLTAELAFETDSAPCGGWRSIAEVVMARFKTPWLYLEPDCVPLRQGWLDILSVTYATQPKRYMGPFLQKSDGSQFLSRVSVYPPDAARDSVTSLIPLSRKTRLIQELRFIGDETKIRQDALLLHGDPTGALVEKLMVQHSGASDSPIPEAAPVESNGNGAQTELLPTIPRRRGRPPGRRPRNPATQ